MISYQTDGIEMPAIKKRETTEWIKAVDSQQNTNYPCWHKENKDYLENTSSNTDHYFHKMVSH